MRSPGPASVPCLAAAAVTGRGIARAAVLAVLLTAAWMVESPAARAQGRPTQVGGVQPLAFGRLVAGVPATVLRTDPARAGRFDLVGRNRSLILLQFTLPAAMNGPLGAQLPLAFGNGSAGYSPSQSIASQTPFDPRTWHLGQLSQQGRGTVFIGGTASPAVAQRSGAYTGTITLTVIIL